MTPTKSLYRVSRWIIAGPALAFVWIGIGVIALIGLADEAVLGVKR